MVARLSTTSVHQRPGWNRSVCTWQPPLSSMQ